MLLSWLMFVAVVIVAYLRARRKNALDLCLALGLLYSTQGK